MLMWQDFPRHVEGRKKTNLEILQEINAEKNGATRQGVDPLTYFQQIEEEEEN